MSNFRHVTALGRYERSSVSPRGRIDEKASSRSFVDEAVRSGFPVDQLFGLEPKGDLLLGRLLRVRAVNDVTAQVDAVITTDRAREGLLRVRLAHHHTSSLGGVLALPNHGNDRPRRDEIDEFVVKGLVFQVDVMLLDMLPGSLHELHGDELEASLFESLDDVADESALDAIRLDHDESAVGVRHDDLSE